MTTLGRGALLALLLLLPVGTAAAAEVKVGMLLKSVNNPFWKSVQDGAMEAARHFPDLDLSLKATSKTINPDQQIQAIEDEVAAGATVIALAPMDEVQLMSVLPELRNQGVRVIVLESDVAWPDKAAFVGSNNVMGGYAAADYIVKRLNGVGKVAIITGSIGDSQSILRTNGAREAFRMNRSIRLVGVRFAGGERYRAVTEMESLLAIHPDLDAVFCSNDEMALGVLEAVRSARAAAFVVGFDASPEVVREIEAGGLAATIAQSPFLIGRLAVASAYRLATGKSIPPFIDSGTTLVTAENIREFKNGGR